MKARGVIVFLGAFVILGNFFCASGTIRPDHIVTTEDQAVERLGDDMYGRFAEKKNCRIGIMNFTTLDWKPTDTGTLLAGKLFNYLTVKKKMNIAGPVGLDRIMKALAIEQAGAYEAEKAKKIQTKVPVDAVILGTVSRVGNAMRIELSVLNVKTGHMSPLYGARVTSPKVFINKDNSEIFSIHEKSPEKLREMNKSYIILYWMETYQPFLFLLSVLNKDEMKNLKTSNAVLHDKLTVRKKRLERQRPDIINKLENLRDGLRLMEKYDSQRHGEIMGWKNALIKTMK
jgi:hypothetical protein